MSHEMTTEDKEYYKDVAHIGNEYVLRMLLDDIEDYIVALRMRTSEDGFLSLKK